MKNKDEMLGSAASIATSVAPTASARVRLRPIDAAASSSGTACSRTASG